MKFLNVQMKSLYLLLVEKKLGYCVYWVLLCTTATTGIKGQIISKGNYGVLNFPNNQKKLF